jgi:hypothetical protein
MSDRELASGAPVPEDESHKKINPATGMQSDYIVLTREERAKGFVKPLRRKYLHTGRLMCGTAMHPYDSDYYGAGAYVVCCGPVGHTGPHGNDGGHTASVATATELDRLRRTGRYKGCGTPTSMSQEIAETYARDPRFYNGTFCVHCKKHFPLNEFEWEPDGETMDPNQQKVRG